MTNGEVAIEGGGMRVRFLAHGDRSSHVIEVAEGPHFRPILESIEGGVLPNTSDAWPASPPLKESYVERRSDGSELTLLVGMAGTSHWSLSTEINKVTRRLTFDVACRLRSTPTWLGSCYHVLSPASADGVVIRFELPWKLLGKQAKPDPMAVELSPGAEPRLILRVAIPAPPLPRTVRWKYTLEPSRDSTP